MGRPHFQSLKPSAILALPGASLNQELHHTGQALPFDRQPFRSNAHSHYPFSHKLTGSSPIAAAIPIAARLSLAALAVQIGVVGYYPMGEPGD